MPAIDRTWIATIAFVLSLSTVVRAQTTWYVDAAATPPGSGTPGSPYASLQYAIAQSTTLAGDTLLAAPGTYTERIDFIGKIISVRSTGGALATIIDGTNGGSVVTFRSGETSAAVLDGFTIQHGSGTVTPTGGQALVDGGGVYCIDSSPTLRNLRVTLNKARRGGGMFLCNSFASLTSCEIRANTDLCYTCYPQVGIGIWAAGSITASQCTIADNGDSTQGGGIHGSGTYTQCTISGNRGETGGGVYAVGAIFDGCTFRSNIAASVDADAGMGGGAFGGTFIGCTFDQNYGGFSGGAACGATLTGCTLTNNIVSLSNSSLHIPRGGGANDCVLTDCSVSGNRAGFNFFTSIRGEGGGIWGGSATRCQIFGNTTYAYDFYMYEGQGGGGASDATLVDCDIHDNIVDGLASGTARGGGVLRGSATRCRIWGNTAPVGGGAADGTLVNCTLSANTATGSGGGVGSVIAAATVRSSIVWNDSSPETAVLGPSGALTISYSDVTGGAAGTGNISADPLFVAPASNDFHLLSGSPCINTGDPALPLDADGTRNDMGAFPSDNQPVTYCVAKVNSLGCTPAIASSGAATISGPDNFSVTGASFLNNRRGLLMWGRASASIPFMNGTLCIGGALSRAGGQMSGGTPPGTPDCTGTYSYHFTQTYMSGHGMNAFDTIYCQWYSRDPANPDGTGVSLSNALAFTVSP